MTDVCSRRQGNQTGLHPSSAGGGLRDEDADQASLCCWLQLLAYTSAALRTGPKFTAADLGLGDVSCSMKLLVQAVVMPGLAHDDEAVR